MIGGERFVKDILYAMKVAYSYCQDFDAAGYTHWVVSDLGWEIWFDNSGVYENMVSVPGQGLGQLGRPIAPNACAYDTFVDLYIALGLNFKEGNNNSGKYIEIAGHRMEFSFSGYSLNIIMDMNAPAALNSYSPKNGNSSYSLNVDESEKASISPPVVDNCTCNSLNLFNFGCKCGAFKKEFDKNKKK